MRFEFHPDALAEYEDAAHYYAGCQDGLELRFIIEVEHVIQQFSYNPKFKIQNFTYAGPCLRRISVDA